MTEPQQTGDSMPKTRARQIVIRMDRSRDFSTIHGERMPGDPHANVFYYQRGLPFDAHGVLLEDHPEIARDVKKQALVEKLRARAAKLLETAPGDGADEEEDERDGLDDDDDGESDEINLAAWARGEQQVKWQHVSDVIVKRFGVRVGSKADGLRLLLEEGVVEQHVLSKDHKRELR